MSKIDQKSDPFPDLPRRGFYSDAEKDAERCPPKPLPIVPGLVPASSLLDISGSSVGLSEEVVLPGSRRKKRSVMVGRVTRVVLATTAAPSLPSDNTKPSGSTNKGGRPKTVGEPWAAMDPPISRAEYYRRKKAGEL